VTTNYKLQVLKYLKYFVFLLLAAVIGIAVYGAVLESDYDLSRSRIIKAPAEVIFDNVNDFKTWENWSPWLEKDPTMVTSFNDTIMGVGATYSWTGKEGKGFMKTISATPNKEIIQQIDFGKGHIAEVYWNFTEVDQGTEVIWGMRGKISFFEKFYWLFKGGIEKNMVPTYDRGLELLEQHVMKGMEKHSFETKGVVDYGGGYYLYQTTSCKIEDIEKKMNEMFPVVMKFMTDNSIETSGKPFTLNHKWDEENNTAMFSVCIPVKERVITTGDVLTGYLKPQSVYKTIFKGDYKFSNDAWEAAYNALSAQGYSEIEGAEPFEVYSVGPKETVNPAKWVTEIYIPVAP
jgi:effector-binding domain-containing protein/ribosome-associated toxin RatA of RatAB toxin-antitoxin module